MCSDLCQLSLQALDLVVYNADSLGRFLRTTSAEMLNFVHKVTHLLDLVNIDQS